MRDFNFSCGRNILSGSRIMVMFLLVIQKLLEIRKLKFTPFCSIFKPEKIFRSFKVKFD